MIASRGSRREVADLGEPDFGRADEGLPRGRGRSDRRPPSSSRRVLHCACALPPRRDRRSDDHQDHQNQHRWDQVADHVGVRLRLRSLRGRRAVRCPAPAQWSPEPVGASESGCSDGPPSRVNNSTSSSQPMTRASTINEKRQFGRPTVPGLLGSAPADAGLGVRSRSRAMIAKPMITTAAHTIAMTTIERGRAARRPLTLGDRLAARGCSRAAPRRQRS